MKRKGTATAFKHHQHDSTVSSFQQVWSDLPIWSFPPTTSTFEQVNTSGHALTVTNFHWNCQVTFNVVQGWCSSPKSVNHWGQLSLKNWKQICGLLPPLITENLAFEIFSEFANPSKTSRLISLSHHYKLFLVGSNKTCEHIRNHWSVLSST